MSQTLKKVNIQRCLDQLGNCFDSLSKKGEIISEKDMGEIIAAEETLKQLKKLITTNGVDDIDYERCAKGYVSIIHH